MSKQKKQAPKKNLEFLKNLEEEDRMHDDHGDMIIGQRDKKPKTSEEKSSVNKK